MGTVEKFFIILAGLMMLACTAYIIYLIWTEWQYRKESKRIEREWREAMAELCAAAGIDPDEIEPEEDAWIKPQPPQRPNPEPNTKPNTEPGTRPNGHTKGSNYSKNDRTPEEETITR